MHDALTIGIPLMAILAGILLNRQDVTSLRTEVSSLRSDMHSRLDRLQNDMHSRLDSIQRDMREFYAEQARHDVRLTSLEQAKERH